MTDQPEREPRVCRAPAPAARPTSSGAAFSPPYNWCDRHCWRCPLPDCRLRPHLALAASQRLLPFEDRCVLEDLLAETAELLRRVPGSERSDRPPARCNGEAVSPGGDGAGQIAFTRLTSRALGIAAGRYVDATYSAVSRLPYIEEADAAQNNALLLYVKIGRLVSFPSVGHALAADRVAGWADAAVNLLLIDRLEHQIAADLQQAAPWVDREAETDGRWLARFEAARVLLRGHLDHWLAVIPKEIAPRLGLLISEGRAPSPFCVLDGGN